MTDGLLLMALGMGTVMAFLVLLVLVMNVTAVFSSAETPVWPRGSMLVVSRECAESGSPVGDQCPVLCGGLSGDFESASVGGGFIRGHDERGDP